MNKAICRLAVPFIISNITVPLVGSVDTALMGHMASNAHLGAVGLGSAIFNFIFWNFAFLRMALAGLTAQAFGQNDPTESGLLLARSLSIAIVGAVAVIVLQSPIASLSFLLAEAEPEVETLARSYYSIRIWAAPATISLYAITGWLIGMQDAKTPMVISLLVNLVNLGANFFFVAVLGMKCEGVAIGTVLAQYVGLLYAAAVLVAKHRNILWSIKGYSIVNASKLRDFFSVNTDVFLRTLSIILVLTFYNFASAEQGTIILGTNVIFLQLILAFSFFVDGFANAGEALVGRYIGEKNRDDFSKAVRYLFYWGAGLSLAFTATYGFGFDHIFAIYTNDTQILTSAKQYAPWIVAIPLFSVGAFVWDGIYLGATATRAQRNITVFSAGFFFAVHYGLVNFFGNHSLLMTQLLFFGCRSLLLTLFYRRAVYNRYF